MTLDPGFYYPLYDPVTQGKVFDAGGTTHKMPHEMNRKERRRVERMQRRKLNAPLSPK